MVRNPRALLSIPRRCLRSYSSIPDHDGTFRVRRVHIVKPIFTIRRLKYTLFCTTMTAILLSKLGSLLDEDEEQTKSSQVKEALRQVKKVREGEKLGPEGEVGLEANEAEAEEVPDEEEDIVPDEQPDDAWFIPVGWPQRKPREYYRGSDPEWRSFTEFAKNEERGRLVRSMYHP